MKSKILAFLMSLSLVSSASVALGVTASAATANPVDEGFVFTCDYAGLDEDNYHVFNFNLDDKNNKLVAVTGSKKYSGNALAQIQYVIDFDSTIFNTSEIYVTKTTAFTAGLSSVSNDGKSPVKYAWVNDDALTQIATLPSDYILSVAVLTNGEYSESEMLAGISFGDDTKCRSCYYDNTSKTNKYETVYAVGTSGDYIVKTRIGDSAVATEGNSYNGRSTFYGTATDIPSVTSTITAEITKGDVTKTDTVETPSGVIGGKSKILPIVSYDSGTVSSGDVFTLILKNGTTEFGKWTYTVPEM